MYNTYSLGKVK